MNNHETFERYEKKYLLNSIQYELFNQRMGEWMEPDEYPENTICNIYYDTPDRRLIRRSLDRPVYKEKLRLRSYGIPDGDTRVFIELKKKYQGIVYKRRVDSTLNSAVEYLKCQEEYQRDGQKYLPQAAQVLREIDWFLSFYGEVVPAMFISYHRLAWKGVEDTDLRLTFDSQIIWRELDLDLKSGVWGNNLLDSGQYLMEVKIAGAMPLWMTAILDVLHIPQVSLSKYGAGYKESLKGGMKKYA